MSGNKKPLALIELLTLVALAGIGLAVALPRCQKTPAADALLPASPTPLPDKH